MGGSASRPRWPFAGALLLVLLVAAGLRLYRLPELPLGLHYDEAANGILAGEIARGIKAPIFIPSYTGKEVLFFYWTALWMKLLGVTPLALRLTAALIGAATVAATVWAVYELLRGQRDARWVALVTAAFVATSFWHLVLSRYGFRAVSQPLLQTLTVAALWRGLGVEKGGLPWLLLAGLLCGLTAYTYLAARAFPIPLAAALLALIVADVDDRRARLGQIALFLAVAALVLAPLARYWLTHPGSFTTRAKQVAATSSAEAWIGIRASLEMFFLKGDPDIRFNLPHRPLFGPVIAVLFLLGIVVVGGRLVAWYIGKVVNGKRVEKYSPGSSPLAPLLPLWRQAPRSGVGPYGPTPSGLRLCSSARLHPASSIFLLIQLLIMLLPGALATDGVIPNHLRAVGLLPFVYIFPALGLRTLVNGIRRLLASNSQSSSFGFLLPTSCVLPPASCLLLLAILMPLVVTAYFGDWASSPALYYAADGDMADAAAYLNRADLSDTLPYVASLHYRHPTLAFLARDYGAVRWLTGGRTVVFPAKGDALLLFPRSASRDLDWVRSVLPDDTLVAAPTGPDGAPAFHVYRVGSGVPLTPTHATTAIFGHAARVLGYDVRGDPRSGQSAEVAVWWRVLNRPDHGDYGPIARLTDPWGFVWGETQPFHYPSEQWMSGEIVVDHLSIPVAPGAPPGDYVVRLGFYSPSADTRLPLLDDADAYAGTHVALPLELARPKIPPAIDDLGIRTRLNVRVDSLTLLGVNLDTSSARPGERLYLTLFWQAGDSPLPDYDIVLTLGDSTVYRGAPIHGAYPTSDWSAGEVVADRYDPRVPRDMPPGSHPLQLHIEDKMLNLGDVIVQATERAFEAPPVSHPITATLGDQVELLGYDLSSQPVTPGGTLTLTLYWRALSEMEEDYTVFTHLVAPDGSMSGQRDSQPVGGTYPTSLWLPEEVVTDVYEIAVGADAVPGEHRLEVGMYVAETGTRLPVEGSVANVIVLQTVTVTE